MIEMLRYSHVVRLSVDFKRLDKHSCEKILFQIEGSGVFAGIERGGFTAALLGGVHYNLFSDGEVLQFTNAVNNSDLFKPIRSACQRLGPQVLWAVYDTLLSTRDVPGAVQHASIASKLRECVQTLAMGECGHGYSMSDVEYLSIVQFIYIHHILFFLFDKLFGFRSFGNTVYAVSIFSSQTFQPLCSLCNFFLNVSINPCD